MARVGLGLVLALATASGALAQPRPLGDFGRPKPSVWHDEVLPALGSGRARLFGEGGSDLIVTDAEREMADRLWRYEISPHAADWVFDASAELRRVRIASSARAKLDLSRYFNWLKSTGYASSGTRFRTVADHVRADIDLLPQAFAAICAVMELDAQRAYAASQLAVADARLTRQVALRAQDNAIAITRFVALLEFRHASYLYALDRLLVESPDPSAREADGRIADLEIWVGEALAGRFCHAPGFLAGRAGQEALPGRVLMGRGDEDAGLPRK
ncbi:hypothetical protein [Devosia enhydra]|uniref:hypothetical protein n=1 Tax=Devosia enhydra TaxID=665118 RepID=UPI000930F065|nr:hypothetical protein [Devosia enhydra]